MHISMKRLYSAIRKDDGNGYTQSEMASKLNQSSQTLKNWEIRGMSYEGALICQKQLGVNSVWIMYGEGVPLIPKTEQVKVAGIPIDPIDVQMNKYFQLLTYPHKDAVLMLVNKLYSIDHPEDAKATGRKTGKKEAKQ